MVDSASILAYCLNRYKATIFYLILFDIPSLLVVLLFLNIISEVQMIKQEGGQPKSIILEGVQSAAYQTYLC